MKKTISIANHTFTPDHKQLAALEGLAFHVFADHEERQKDENSPELSRIVDNVHYSMHECDSLNIPYWVQNKAIAYGSDRYIYKTTYFTSYMFS